MLRFSIHLEKKAISKIVQHRHLGADADTQSKAETWTVQHRHLGADAETESEAEIETYLLSL